MELVEERAESHKFLSVEELPEATLCAGREGESWSQQDVLRAVPYGLDSPKWVCVICHSIKQMEQTGVGYGFEYQFMQLFERSTAWPFSWLLLSLNDSST